MIHIYLFLILSLISHFTFAGDGANEIRKKNKLKADGTKAFQKKEYKKAIEKFSYLLDTLKTEDDRVRMNLATATLLNGDSAGALLQYQKVLASQDKKLRSLALQQSSVLAFHQKQYKDAMELSKEALKQDPSNKDARYNYELLKKILQENPQNQDNKNQDKKDNDPKNEDQQNKDQQNQQNKQNQQDKNEQQNKQGQDEKKENQKNEKQDGKNKEEEKNSKEQQEKKDKEKEKSKEGKEEKKDDKSAKKDSSNAFPPNQAKPLKPMKISPEKARMILEALRSSEKQYLQQLQKKPEKSRKKEGPDW